MYNFTLVETNADGRVVIDGNTTNTELSVEESVTVSPFTNYTVTVVAFTSVGSGDSVVQVALSPEASKFILCVYVCVCMYVFIAHACVRFEDPVLAYLTLHFYHSPWPSAESDSQLRKLSHL